MEWMYVGIVAFLFLLAAFDLWVGVSNDAVNFMNSAIGSKVAKFRTIVTVAAIGVFFGATLSDGMMDIARHGIFRPEEFVFGEVMIIFLAVMVTDVVLLDIFNTLGMPTSTTVSMVFELLGASFAFSMIKIASSSTATDFGDYLNTDKALEVIMAIFVSVAIAFVVGSLIQYLARLAFTFNFKSKLKWKIGIFGGLGITAILYFMILKGLKHMAGIPQEALDFVNQHEGWVLLGSFVFFTLLMQLLYALKVNVFRVIVLAGTFALATAFAGNDLVNFIGVPLAGWSSFLDFSASGAADRLRSLDERTANDVELAAPCSSEVDHVKVAAREVDTGGGCLLDDDGALRPVDDAHRLGEGVLLGEDAKGDRNLGVPHLVAQR